MKTSIRTDLLRQLADHLLNGKLGHQRFNFGSFNVTESDIENTCGTSGCAAGECPILWADQWKFAINRTVRLINPVVKNDDEEDDVWSDLKQFFGISRTMAYHLFCPSEGNEEIGDFEEVTQIPDAFGGCILGYNAGKEAVASNIQIFCDKVDAGEIIYPTS